MRITSLALTFALCAIPAAAEDDFGLLHITNGNIELNGKSTLQIHTRVRTYYESSRFFQFRAGPIYMHAFSPRVLGLAGYYFISQDSEEKPANTVTHRIWTGPQFRVVEEKRWAIDTRHLAERFVVMGKDDFTRLRNRAMLIYRNGRLQPFTSFEALVQNGDWYERHAAGVQIAAQNQVSYSISYEYRASPTGRGIHLIATTIQFRAFRLGPPHID